MNITGEECQLKCRKPYSGLGVPWRRAVRHRFVGHRNRRQMFWFTRNVSHGVTSCQIVSPGHLILGFCDLSQRQYRSYTGQGGTVADKCVRDVRCCWCVELCHNRGGKKNWHVVLDVFWQIKWMPYLSASWFMMHLLWCILACPANYQRSFIIRRWSCQWVLSWTATVGNLGTSTLTDDLVSPWQVLK